MELSITLMLALLLVPLAVAIALPFFNSSPNLREAVTLFGSIVLLICAAMLYQTIDFDNPPQLILAIPLPNYPILFSPDPLGIMFSLLVSTLWPITSLYAIGYMRQHKELNQTRFYCFFALSIAVTQAIALSGNMLTLFIFYEMLTLATFPLVTHAGSKQAKQAGRLYLGILMGTSIMFLLLATIWSANIAGTLAFQADGIFPADTDPFLLNILLLLFVFGTAKAALMPFHRWLPAAMVAPVPVSALLHAVAVVKAGVFTLLKVVIYLFGIDNISLLPAADFLAYLAGFTIVAASLIALKQDNIKARLAYSTIGQLSYIILGTMLATSSSIMGSSMHIVTHAFGKITLFFCAGAILLATHKTRVSELNGIGKQIPITLCCFTLAALSTIGLPPFAGMWSKWWLVQGTLESGQLILTASLLISSLLNLIYLLEIPLRAFFFQQSTTPLTFKEPLSPHLLAIGTTTLLCLLLFLKPDVLYHLINLIDKGL